METNLHIALDFLESAAEGNMGMDFLPIFWEFNRDTSMVLADGLTGSALWVETEFFLIRSFQ
jgi:hypothetical protein